MFKVLLNLKHDGTDYVKGDVLVIDKERGMIMVKQGILKYIDTPEEESMRLQRDDKVVEVKAKTKAVKEDKPKVEPKVEAKKEAKKETHKA